jgi:hypothetical protein
MGLGSKRTVWAAEELVWKDGRMASYGVMTTALLFLGSYVEVWRTHKRTLGHRGTEAPSLRTSAFWGKCNVLFVAQGLSSFSIVVQHHLPIGLNSFFPTSPDASQFSSTNQTSLQSVFPAVYGGKTKWAPMTLSLHIDPGSHSYHTTTTFRISHASGLPKAISTGYKRADTIIGPANAYE